MKKSSSSKRGGLDSEKSGWIRKFCGKGLFREIWKNRFMILKQDQVYICRKEVKDPSRSEEVLDLLDFDRCEEMRKNRSRSKKNHSKFRLVSRTTPRGETVSSVVFLAVSPEEKESWIQVLNQALTRAKNRVLDEVTVEDVALAHLTRDRVRIQHTRRPPTRGHLLAVASASSDGALTLDLIHEEEPSPRSRPETETRKPHTLPRQVAPGAKVASEKSVSLDQIPQDHSPAQKSESISRLQDLILEKIQRTEQLLNQLRPEPGLNQDQGLNKDLQPNYQNPGLNQEPGLNENSQPNQKTGLNQDPELNQDQAQEPKLDPGLNQDQDREEAWRLLNEARDQWNQAHQVLNQVQELKELYLAMDPSANANPS